jgi:hypothetical protein
MRSQPVPPTPPQPFPFQLAQMLLGQLERLSAALPIALDGRVVGARRVTDGWEGSYRTVFDDELAALLDDGNRQLNHVRGLRGVVETAIQDAYARLANFEAAMGAYRADVAAWERELVEEVERRRQAAVKDAA